MYEYGIPQDRAQGQASASTSSPSMLPPPTSSEFRHDHLQQQQQQQQPYPYGYDSTYPPQNAGPSSYDYTFQRAPMPSGMEGMPSPYGNGHGNGSWDSPYQGGSSSSNERINRDPPSWMMGEGNGIYGQMGMHGTMSRSDSGHMDGNGHINGHGHGGGGLGLGGDEETWRRNGSAWGNDYGRPAGPDAGLEKELEALRSNVNDLVESIRPYATTANNPRPPRPPPYAQQRFVRLAATVQATLSTLQPHMHPLLHPEFLLTPPKPRSDPRSDQNGSGHTSGAGPSSSIKPLSAAEEEMEIIRKRRDMLIARAAQVNASHQQQHPPPPLNQHPTVLYPQHIQSPQQQHAHPPAQQYQYSQMHNQDQFQPNWNHTDIYGNGGLYNNPQPMPMGTNNNGSPYPSGAALAPFDDNTNANPRRTNIDTFDPDLARFSLVPAKPQANQEKPKKSPPEGKCHGCHTVHTAEWRRGPDGPRSLCNACGLHYAKLTRKRAQEEAQIKMAQAQIAAPAS